MQTTLMVCDIQPEYERSFDFKIWRFAKFLNRSIGQRGFAYYFYNGYDTIGMITEDELKFWLYENGVTEETLNRIKFIDKGYGFLSTALDDDVSHRTIIAGIRRMKQGNKYETIVKGNQINWNESFDIIQNHKKIVYVGGSVDACLLELLLATKAFKVRYTFNKEFVYR